MLKQYLLIFRIFPKIRFSRRTNLSELINVYSPWSYQKIYALVMISGEIEDN